MLCVMSNSIITPTMKDYFVRNTELHTKLYRDKCKEILQIDIK
jgi:hypothetical protein